MPYFCCFLIKKPIFVKKNYPPQYFCFIFAFKKEKIMARDKLKKYEKAILSILDDYTQIRYSNINAENKLIADKQNHRYQVVTIGWDKNKFVHDCPMHIDIIDGKIWIQRNMTEIDVASVLTQQGVAKSDIVLGFLSPKMREYSDYALA
jgi:XisI protein